MNIEVTFGEVREHLWGKSVGVRLVNPKIKKYKRYTVEFVVENLRPIPYAEELYRIENSAGRWLHFRQAPKWVRKQIEILRPMVAIMLG